MYTIDNFEKLFSSNINNLLSIDGFIKNSDYDYRTINCSTVFLGMECMGKYTFSQGELIYIELIPTGDFLKYLDEDGFPGEKYDKAVRKYIEPLLNETYGQKQKRQDWNPEHDSLTDDGYRWYFDNYQISIMPAHRKFNRKGGIISIYRR